MASLGRALLGRTAIVTGSPSGNGRAIALALAKAGANVLCSDLTPDARPEGYEEDRPQPTHLSIQTQYKGNSLFQKCNVQSPAQIKDLVACAARECGRLDIMVNNAGIFTGLKTILEETEEEFDLTMGVNTKGTYFGSKYAIQQFLSQKTSSPSGQCSHSTGKIINIASMGGLIGLKEEAAYCASKGAVVNLTRQLAVDFGKKGVNINVVCPGFMATAMVRPFLDDPVLKKQLDESTPWPVLGTAEDVANSTLWLASTDSDFMNGSILTIDGGFTAREKVRTGQKQDC